MENRAGIEVIGIHGAWRLKCYVRGSLFPRAHPARSRAVMTSGRYSSETSIFTFSVYRASSSTSKAARPSWPHHPVSLQLPQPLPDLNEFLNDLRWRHPHTRISARIVTSFVVILQYSALHIAAEEGAQGGRGQRQVHRDRAPARLSVSGRGQGIE